MKYEWRKKEKEIYLPKSKPVTIEIPKYRFFLLKGKGNPNHEDFSLGVGALYSLSYTVRMMPRQGYIPEGYFEYGVYPLEGVWSLSEAGRDFAELNKDELEYDIMIRQPDFVTSEVFEQALEMAKKKKNSPFLEEVTLQEVTDGLSVQIMHTGSYDDEPESFEKMERHMEENHLVRRTKIHREIYLSDPRRTAPERMKTVLRVFVKEK